MATDRVKNRWNQVSRLVGSKNFRHTVHTIMKRARKRLPRQRAPHALLLIRLLLSSMKRMDFGLFAPRCRAKPLTGSPTPMAKSYVLHSPSHHDIHARQATNRIMNHHQPQIDVRILNQGLPDPCMKSIPILTDENLKCGYVEWSLFSNSKEQANRHPEIVDKISSRPIWPLALIESLEVWVDYRGRGYGRKGLRTAINAAEQAGAAFAFLKVGWAPSVDDPEAECAWKIRFFQSEGFELADRNDDCEPVLMFRPLAMKSVYTHQS